MFWKRKTDEDLERQEVTKAIKTKVRAGQNLSYDEYEFIVLTNDEVAFLYNGFEYEIVHNKKVAMFRNKYQEKKIVFSDNIGEFSSVAELLQQVRIEDKFIKDIWENSTYNAYYAKTKNNN